MITIRKLSPIEWLKLVAALLPFLRDIVRAAGLSVRDFIRRLLDITAQVEDAIPNEIVDGVEIKKGQQRLELWEQLVGGAFATEGESPPILGRLTELAGVLVGLLNAFGAWKRS